MKKLVTVILTSLFCCFVQQADAAYIFKNGKLIDSKDVAYLTVEEHYNLGIAAIKEKTGTKPFDNFEYLQLAFQTHLMLWTATTFSVLPTFIEMI